MTWVSVLFHIKLLEYFSGNENINFDCAKMHKNENDDGNTLFSKV